MIKKNNFYKSDGENTVRRMAKADLNRHIAIRRVLKGFPYKKQLETHEEIKNYFRGDRIQCLLCGKPYKSLATHLVRVHGMTVDKYKKRYGLPWVRGLVCDGTRSILKNNMEKRIKEDGLKIGVLYMSEKQKRKLWDTPKRKPTPVNKQRFCERGAKVLSEYTKMHPAKIKPIPKSLVNWLARSKRDQKIIKLAKQGQTVRQIYEGLKIHKKTVHKILKPLCLVTEKKQIYAKVKRLKKKIVRLRNKGKKIREIANIVNRSSTRVQQILREERK